MDWKLELIEVPVTDIDRAKAFYAEQLGFNVDIDHAFDERTRFVQLTPPGSGCSINIGTGIGIAEQKPGSAQGLVLVVADVVAAQAELLGRGVEVGELMVFDAGEMRPRREGESLDNVGFVLFDDPDGNRWGVQQIPPRG
jgi:catechol 2,3-dioxygenase-like lactoylglutathione lyase family enzyme